MEQPTIQDEKELMDINDDAKTIVEIPRSKKKYKIGYLKSYCTEKVTKIIGGFWVGLSFVICILEKGL